MAIPSTQAPVEVRPDAKVEASRLIVHSYDLSVRSEWDRFVSAHVTGSPFHLIAWKHVLEKTFGYEACYFYAERDGKVTGVAPLFLISNWIMGRCLISVPFGVYGGICATDAESEVALLEHVKGLALSARVKHLELRNRSGYLFPKFHSNQLYVTFMSELLSDPEQNLKRLPKDTRYMIRKAAKAGLEARYGTEQLELFYALFSRSMQRHGTPVFPLSLFENLIREFQERVDLLMIYAGSKPICGTLLLSFGDTVLPYYAGASDEAARLGANNYMYWKVMEKAAREGLRRFDFGRSKKGTGSYAFKTQWSMSIEPLNYQAYLVRRQTPPNFSPLNPKFQLATRVWQKMPLPLTRWIGPRVVRCFP